MKATFSKYLMIVLLGTLVFRNGPVAAREFNHAQDKVQQEVSRKYIVDFKQKMLNSLPFFAKATIIKATGNEDEYIIENIAHENKSWKGRFRAKDIESTWALRQKMFLGQFHLSVGFKFKGVIDLQSMEPGDKSRSQTKMITMGTGPTFNNGMPTLMSFYSISMKTQSIEQVMATYPESAEKQQRLDSGKVDTRKLFTAFAEEANRTYFMQQLRLARLDGRIGNVVRDPMKLGRYRVFASNCITSVVRNLSMALYPEYQQMILDSEELKNNIRSFDNVMDQDELVERIKTFEKGAKEVDRYLAAQLKENTIENPLMISSMNEVVGRSYILSEDYIDTFGKDNKIIMPAKSNDFVDLVALTK